MSSAGQNLCCFLVNVQVMKCMTAILATDTSRFLLVLERTAETATNYYPPGHIPVIVRKGWLCSCHMRNLTTNESVHGITTRSVVGLRVPHSASAASRMFCSNEMEYKEPFQLHNSALHVLPQMPARCLSGGNGKMRNTVLHLTTDAE